MTKAKLLSADDRAGALKSLAGWKASSDGKSLTKTFTFKGFEEAFGFMTSVALVAAKMDHHPDWSNSWNKVEVTLSSHDAGGVTANDVALAEAMNRFAG